MATQTPIEVLQGNDEEIEFTFIIGSPGRRVPYVIPDDAHVEFTIRKSQSALIADVVLRAEVINSSKGKCVVYLSGNCVRQPGTFWYRTDIVRAGGARKTGAYGELRVLAV